MFGDVNVTIEDRKVNRSVSGIGAQVKIGIGLMNGKSPVQITGAMDAGKIKEKLGNTPLAAACMDAVENGANEIYCIPVAGENLGSIGEQEHTGTGTGKLVLEGKPGDAYEVVVEITESGKRNEGAFRYSLDGQIYSEEITIPEGGEYILEGTGLKLKFEDASEGDSFVEKDVYVTKTTAPSMSNQEVLTAVNSLFDMNLAFEFIHVVGESGKALWAALAALADKFLKEKKSPCYFICEARKPKQEENLEDYVEEMRKERKGINNIYIQVVCSHSEYMRMDGTTKAINNAGIVSGLYCRAKESQSIGEVRSFPVLSTKMLRLLPEGIEKVIKELDAIGYLTFRQYVGLEEYFVSNAKMFAPEGSDYQYAEDVRVSNRLVKEVRAKALEELQGEIDPSEAETSLLAVQANLNIPIETAQSEGIIGSGQAVIDIENVDILEDEVIDVSIQYVPKGHIRTINLTFAVENPNV